MKKKIVPILCSLLLLAGCQQEKAPVVNRPVINVTKEKLSPAADLLGTVRAFVGTQVTARGFNLDRVGLVTVDGVQAPIVEQTIKTLVFEIPALPLAQNDDPYAVKLVVYDIDGETVIFQYEYYVTIPVTDALVSSVAPLSGTVGTEVVVSGRNLSQVTAVSFGGTAVADFVAADDKVTFSVPAIEATAASTDAAISVRWGGGTIDCTGETPFAYLQPVFSTLTQAAPAVLGDEVVLSGENFALVTSVRWGEEDLLIADRTATTMTVKIPSGIAQADPAVVAKDLVASFGTPVQPLVILSGFQVDTTPVGPAAPVFASATPSDEGYKQFYLGREVTVKGDNMASVEGFEVDGIAVTVSTASTDIEARFVMPTTITGTAAKDVTLVALWNGGNRLECGTIQVCPFYFYKGVRIGIGSNSKSTYTAYARENAFILLNEGKVISSDDWLDKDVDPFAKSGNNTVTAAGGRVTEDKETEYYSVQPYLFAGSNSGNKLSLYNPANTANQLKQHYATDNKTALPTAAGTPVIWLAVVSDDALKATVSDGMLQDIKSAVPKAGSGALDAVNWFNHGLITIQYTDYETAKAGSKPGEDLDGVRQCGLAYVRDITCVTEAGAANADREGYIELDIYWSNVL